MQLKPYQHLMDAVYEQINRRPNDVILENYQSKDCWKAITWRRLRSIIECIGDFLLKKEFAVGDRMTIFATNAAQWTCADLAVLAIRGVSVPVYPTSTKEQLSFILEDTQSKVICVDTQERYDLLCSILPDMPWLQHVIVFDHRIQLRSENHIHLELLLRENVVTGAQFEERRKQASLTDLATLIYTSGTTGNPKGVMLDHQNFASSFAQHKLFVHYQPGQVSLSFYH